MFYQIATKLLLVISDVSGDFDLKFDLDKNRPFTVFRELSDQINFGSYDVILLLAITRKKLREKTIENKDVRSKYKIGEEQVVNPAYLSAQSRYNAAINSYNIAYSNLARASAAYNSYSTLINSALVYAASTTVETAKTKRK